MKYLASGFSITVAIMCVLVLSDLILNHQKDKGDFFIFCTLYLILFFSAISYFQSNKNNYGKE